MQPFSYCHIKHKWKKEKPLLVSEVKKLNIV